MTDSRLDGSYLSVLNAGVPDARLDRIGLDTLYSPIPDARLDGAALAVLTPLTKPAPPTKLAASKPDAIYEADSLDLADGTAISYVQDLSGNNYNLTQNNAASRPTYIAKGTPSGKPVMRFASAHGLLSNAPAGASAQTVISVVSPKSSSGAQSIRSSSVDGGLQLRYNQGQLEQVKQYYSLIGSGVVVSPLNRFEIVATRFEYDDGAFYIATASTEYNASAGASAAVDSSVDTVWLANAQATVANPQWLRLEPKTPTVATSFKILSRANRVYYQPRDFTFEGSNDAQTWTVLTTQANVSWTNAAETKTFSFANTIAYKYYRLKCTSTIGVTDYVEIGSIELNNNGPALAPSAQKWTNFRNGVKDGTGTANVIPFISSTTTVGYSPHVPGEYLNADMTMLASWSRALSDTEITDITAELKSKWIGDYAFEVLADAPMQYLHFDEPFTIVRPYCSSSVSPETAANGFGGNTWSAQTQVAWLAAQLKAPVVLTSYAFTCRADAPARVPKYWTFEGSQDGSSWTILDTQSNVPWLTGERRTFTFSNITAYLHYRVNVTGTGGQNASIADLVLGDQSRIRAEDSSPNARSGFLSSLENGYLPQSVDRLFAGSDGKALSFDGVNPGHVWVPYSSWMNSGVLTLETVMILSSAGGGELWARDDSSSQRTFQAQMSGSSGTITWIWWTSTGGPYFYTPPNGSIPTDRVIHFALVADGTTIAIYVGGVLIGSTPQNGPLKTTASGDLAIGAFRHSPYVDGLFNGRMDEFAWYNTALSQARIAAHAALVTALPPTTPATGFWGLLQSWS